MECITPYGPQQTHFSTILASRRSDHRPSDLEFALRPYCKRLIVKGKPLSGAHLLFAAERIAVRVYYPCDLRELKEKEENRQKQNQRESEPSALQNQNEKETASGNDEGRDKDNFDGLAVFFSSFQLALVLFVLPPANNQENYNDHDATISEQLNDLNSHFHRAQRLAVKQERLQQQKLSKAMNKNKNLRVILLPDTESAVKSLVAVANATTQEKKDCKELFFRRLATNNYLPLHIVEGTNIGQVEAVIEASAARHAAKGLRTLAQIFDWPEGEADLLMSGLGSLRAIATTNERPLEGGIPIDHRTRLVLQGFFGSSMSSSPLATHSNERLKGETGPSREERPGEQSTFSVGIPIHRTKIATELFPKNSLGATSYALSPHPAILPSSPMLEWNARGPQRGFYNPTTRTSLENEFYREETNGNYPFSFDPNPTSDTNHIPEMALPTMEPLIQIREDEIPELEDPYNSNRTSSSFQPSPWGAASEQDANVTGGPRPHEYVPFANTSLLPRNQAHYHGGRNSYSATTYGGGDSQHADRVFVHHHQRLPYQQNAPPSGQNTLRRRQFRLPSSHPRRVPVRREMILSHQQGHFHSSQIPSHSLDNFDNASQLYGPSFHSSEKSYPRSRQLQQLQLQQHQARGKIGTNRRFTPSYNH
eukprot:jgi/Psemu1/288403/fgenesh1_pg.258_\